MPLRVFQSWCLHRPGGRSLLQALLDTLATSPLADPLAPEVLVVGARGMDQWLRLKLAEHLGIACNLEFSFPRRAVDRILAAVQNEGTPWSTTPDPNLFDLDVLPWAIAARLPGLAAEHSREFEPVIRYLDAAGGDPVARTMRLLDLSREIARVFDQYALFRSDGMWSSSQPATPSPHGPWQRILWNDLIEAGARPLHQRYPGRERFAEKVAETRWPTDFPRRISVFGLSALPAPFVEILALTGRYSAQIAVDMYLLVPSCHWIGNHLERPRTPEELADSARHPLISLCGRSAVAFQNAVDAVESQPEFIDTEAGTATTLLRAVQRDIVTLQNPHAKRSTDRWPIDPDDRSVMIHDCHSPLREIEVLHDVLSERFAADPTLQPRDVVVMMPDVEAYAPHVHAVFADPLRMRIPYGVADRLPRSDHPHIEAIFRLLALAEGRLEAMEVLDLAAIPPVAERFGLTAGDVAELRKVVTEIGVRWGLDGDERKKRLGLSKSDERFTWAHALRRLLAGYAVASGGRPRVAAFGEPVAPFDAVEGQAAERVGALAELLDALADWRTQVAQPLTPAQWQACIGRALHDWMAPPVDDEARRDVQRLRDVAAELEKHATAAGFVEEIPAAAIAALIESALGTEPTARAFLTRGVTFCALTPMRSIPFRFVAILGLDDESFPRKARRTEQDQLGENGNEALLIPTVRDDDLLTFLEAVLGAQDALHLSYVGRNAQDNQKRTASVAIATLLDVIDATVATHDPSHKARQHVLVRHHLYPFDPAYFAATKPEIYPQSNLSTYCKAAEHLAGAGTSRLDQRWFWPDPSKLLDKPTAAELSADDLVRFCRDPQQELLARLGLYPPEKYRAWQPWEPIWADALGQHTAGERAAKWLLYGEEARAVRAWVAAERRGPAGPAGALADDEVLRAAQRLADAIRRETDPDAWGRRVVTANLQVDGDHVCVSATCSGLACDHDHRTQHVIVFGRDTPDRRLRAWIRHLLLAAAGELEWRTVLWMCDPTAVVTRHDFEPPESADQASAHLTTLLHWVRRGQQGPIAWFRWASNAFVTQWISAPKADPAAREREAFKEARKSFERSFDSGGQECDCKSWAVQLIWGAGARWQHVDHDQFRSIIEDVYAPMESALGRWSR